MSDLQQHTETTKMQNTLQSFTSEHHHNALNSFSNPPLSCPGQWRTHSAQHCWDRMRQLAEIFPIFCILADLSFSVQVVERLLALPADYWGQYLMAESYAPNLDHLIIENSNCYATPERSTSSLDFVCFFSCRVYMGVCAQLFAFWYIIVISVLLQWACWDLWRLQSSSWIKRPPPAPCLSAWSPLWRPGKQAHAPSAPFFP